MKIISISGSNRKGSTNLALLKIIGEYEYFNIDQLPLFVPNEEESEVVQIWKQKVGEADALIITTPEYLHNIPATLKNALEHLTNGGELYENRVLPIVFTPQKPRGEKAMQSLLWSLQALNANIVCSLLLDHSDFVKKDQQIHFEGEGMELIAEAIVLINA